VIMSNLNIVSAALCVNVSSQVAHKNEDDADEVANAASQMSSALLRIGALCDFMDVTEGNSERAYVARPTSGNLRERRGEVLMMATCERQSCGNCAVAGCNLSRWCCRRCRCSWQA